MVAERDRLGRGPRVRNFRQRAGRRGWVAQSQQRRAAPEYLEFKLSLEDVDLGELLRRLQVKMPFPLEGKLTFQVQAAIPVNTPQDLKYYRLNGTATLPRVNIAGVDMTDVQTRLRFEKGVLELQELKGRTTAAEGRRGRLVRGDRANGSRSARRPVG